MSQFMRQEILSVARFVIFLFYFGFMARQDYFTHFEQSK